MMQLYYRIENTTITALRIVLDNCIVQNYAAGTEVCMWANVSRRMDDVGEREDRCGLLIEPLTQRILSNSYEEQLILWVEG